MTCLKCLYERRLAVLFFAPTVPSFSSRPFPFARLDGRSKREKRTSKNQQANRNRMEKFTRKQKNKSCKARRNPVRIHVTVSLLLIVRKMERWNGVRKLPFDAVVDIAVFHADDDVSVSRGLYPRAVLLPRYTFARLIARLTDWSTARTS